MEQPSIIKTLQAAEAQKRPVVVKTKLREIRGTVEVCKPHYRAANQNIVPLVLLNVTKETWTGPHLYQQPRKDKRWVAIKDILSVWIEEPRIEEFSFS